MSLASALAFPVRLGFAAADSALGVAEGVIGTVRLAVSPQTYAGLNAVGVASP
ncbi:MAG: ABC transporter, partial [Acidobacteria bacterium]